MSIGEEVVERIVDDLGITMEAARSMRQSHPRALPGTTFWDCTLRRDGAQDLVYREYSMGPALKGPPTASEVLQTLFDDAVSDVVRPRGVRTLQAFLGKDVYEAAVDGEYGQDSAPACR